LLDNSLLKLHCGDALKILPTINNKFDVVLTDPPYSAAFVGHFYEVLKKYQKGINLKQERPKNTWNWAGIPGYWSDMYYKTNDEFENFTENWMKEVFRLLLPGGFLATFAVNKLIHINVSLAQSAGFVLRDIFIWHYSAAYSRGMSLSKITKNESDKVYNTTVAPSYEPIILLQKPLEGNTITNWQKHKTGMIDTRYLKSNVIKIQKSSKKEKEDNPHYAIKPVALLEKLCRGLCAKSVLDPFMGSGSTGEVCGNIGNIYFEGIELEKEFYDYAEKRLDKFN
jgi:site-specific DNA-methyltransferase (adenine-specific)